jgi:3-hydroxyisobutyrate dehydrogenase-like beta-hydroxyacid dehydrogenase
MRISVVGLGIMGRAVTSKLLDAGHDVTIWNRTPGVADNLLARGATWATTPAAAAFPSSVTLSFVTNPDAVSAITLGPDGIMAGLPMNCVHAEMSTVSPDSAKKLAELYAAQGKLFVQAPVMGSRVQIEQKMLLVAAGGNASSIDKCMDVWMTFSKQVWTLPAAEQASALKLSVNMLLAQMIVALGQSFAFGKSFGVEPSTFLEVIMQSSLASAQYQSKGTSVLKGDFTPNFTVANLLKDVNLAKNASSHIPGGLPLNDMAADLFASAIANGFGAEDYSTVIKSIAKAAGASLL